MNRANSAFTLIELIVTMTITVLVLSAAAELYLLGLARWNPHGAKTDAQLKTSQLLAQMENDVRNAIWMQTGNVNGNPIYTFTLPNNTDSSGNYVPAIVGGRLLYQDGMQIRYYLSDTTGSQGVVGGTNVWRATAPAGSSTFTPDTSWSLEAENNPRYSDFTQLTFTLDDEKRVANIRIVGSGTEGTRVFNFSQSGSFNLGNASSNSIYVALNPRATYLTSVNDPLAVASTAIDLQSYSIFPGDTIVLDVVGAYSDSTLGADNDTAVIGVFGTSPTLGAASSSNRVTGATAPSYNSNITQVTTPNTNSGSTSTNITQDFTLPNLAGGVTVPAGCRYLFLAASDSYYSDNSDLNNDFAVVVTKTR